MLSSLSKNNKKLLSTKSNTYKESLSPKSTKDRGESKSFSQIAEITDSFILADDIESPRGNKLPLWMIGFLY